MNASPRPYDTVSPDVNAKIGRISPIRSKHEMVATLLNDLEGSIARLREKMTPLLGPVSSRPTVNEDSEVPDQSELAHILDSYGRQITALGFQIEELNSRFEM